MKKISLLILIISTSLSTSWAEQKPITLGLKIIDINKPNDSEFRKLVDQSGLSTEEWVAEQYKEAELLKKPFSEDVNENLMNIDEFINYKADYLNSDLTNIIPELGYKPKLLHQFKPIFFEAGGPISDGTHYGLMTIYESPYGKLLITESDLAHCQCTISVSNVVLNAKVGSYPATLRVRKGLDSYLNADFFETTIDWVNTKNLRSYQVTINKNLNDPALQHARNTLITELDQSYDY